ncbi:hypothetical protein DFH06DRAFT_91201 [Mycena polygramma]|nr:hypothetical protein DFH06DRAFT_91201 [Mycena polygramma]
MAECVLRCVGRGSTVIFGLLSAGSLSGLAHEEPADRSRWALTRGSAVKNQNHLRPTIILQRAASTVQDPTMSERHGIYTSSVSP